MQARQGCEASLPLVQGLLNEWLLVPNWHAAEECSADQKHLQRKFGLVTQCASTTISAMHAVSTGTSRYTCIGIWFNHEYKYVNIP